MGFNRAKENTKLLNFQDMYDRITKIKWIVKNYIKERDGDE